VSSLAVRDSVMAFLAAEFPSEKLIDLSAEYDQFDQLMEAYGLTLSDDWLGIQFVGDEEEPVALSANNAEGGYREYGSIAIHCVTPASMNGRRPMLQRAENIRKKLRGQRLSGGVMIMECNPANTEAGAAIQFDSGFMGATFFTTYYIDISATP